MTSIIRPKFLALDSSHLTAIARAKFSSKEDERQKALKFEHAADQGFILLLLCWEHVQELLSHRDNEVVEQRISWIRSLPLVATIASIRGEEIPGSILDIQSFEIRAAFEAPESSLLEVRDFAAKNIIRILSGAELIRPFVESWPVLQSEFARSEARKREIVAISRSNFADISNVKISTLLRGKTQTSTEIQNNVSRFHNRLAQDIRQRGDRRIPDAESTSRNFFEEVRRFGSSIASGPNPGLQILLANDIDPSEIGPSTTVGDIAALAAFQKKLSVINRNLNLPWPQLKARAKERRLPSGVIQSALSKFRPDTMEWKGSDLTDAYLCCLSPYVDVTYVDKRTHEAARRARKKSKEFAAITRQISKAAHYNDVVGQLGG